MALADGCPALSERLLCYWVAVAATDLRIQPVAVAEAVLQGDQCCPASAAAAADQPQREVAAALPLQMHLATVAGLPQPALLAGRPAASWLPV